MTIDESARFLRSADVATIVPDEYERATLAATSLTSDIGYYELIHCNLPARPFFQAQRGRSLCSRARSSPRDGPSSLPVPKPARRRT